MLLFAYSAVSPYALLQPSSLIYMFDMRSIKDNEAGIFLEGHFAALSQSRSRGYKQTRPKFFECSLAHWRGEPQSSCPNADLQGSF